MDFLAEDTLLDPEIALKFLKVFMQDDPAVRK